MARLVQPGKQGGWIAGSLSWGKLGGYGYYNGPSATQVRLLRELVALYRTRAGSSGYDYPAYDERSIELSAVEIEPGYGRCSTRSGRPGCAWYTDASSARSTGTTRPSSS